MIKELNSKKGSTMNHYTDFEHVELVLQRIEAVRVDITSDYDKWMRIAFAFANSFGEDGREFFHRVSRFWVKDGKCYSHKECDEKYDNCLRTRQGRNSVASFFEYAKEYGIDVSLPKGRRPKSEEEKQEEEKNRFQRIIKWLEPRYEFRRNIISEQVEIRCKDMDGNDWQDMDDAKKDTLLTYLHAESIYVAKGNLESYISSEMLAPRTNPIREYAESLKPWNTRQKDYITELFEHLNITSENREQLLRLAKKWFVTMVMRACDLDDPEDPTSKNELMIILAGDKEFTGKTTFVKLMLPAKLRRYESNNIQLSNFKDKDELLPLSRNIIALCDELTVNRTTLNKLKNYVGGATATYTTERTQYGHFTARRKVRASWIATTNKEVGLLPESTGSRRFLVMHVTDRGRDYKSMNQNRAFAQAYWLATHPEKFSAKLTTEEVMWLKEVNEQYVEEDTLAALLRSVLREPEKGEKALAADTGMIRTWLYGRYGLSHDYTSIKIGQAMKKLGIAPHKTNRGQRYLVVQVKSDDAKKESEDLAAQILNSEKEPV